jgi:hypothetical protein
MGPLAVPSTIKTIQTIVVEIYSAAMLITAEEMGIQQKVHSAVSQYPREVLVIQIKIISAQVFQI